MIKVFCDVCKNEIRRNVVHERYRPAKYFRDALTNVQAEVVVTIEKVANKGDLCLPCLISVLTQPDCEVKQ